jgi:Lon protease-like protein
LPLVLAKLQCTSWVEEGPTRRACPTGLALRTDAMDLDNDLRDFRNVCRLFPLPDVVLFPHAVLPLHIFEPRYRQMTEDALAGDKLVTIVQLRPDSPGEDPDRPAIETVGCLGKIVRHERLPDGRFNFLLVGRKRVRLMRELPSAKLYRLAEARILEDEAPEEPVRPLRRELIGLFRAVTEREGALDPDMAKLLQAKLALGILTDIIAHALGLPAALKQTLLEDCCVARRARALVAILRQLVDQAPPGPAAPDRSFPPPFSNN